jgi:transcriptional regulator with XRE-family HTH domain
MGLMSDQVTSQVARLLRMQREKADLSQSALAAAAGTTQQRVSRIEQGRHAPSLAVLDRLFAVLGHQLRVELEELDADVDTTIDRVGELTDDKRAEAMGFFGYLLDKLAGVPYLIEGELGAILHGVPLKTSTLSLAVAQADLDAVAAWLMSIPNCSRWNPHWEGFDPSLYPDPRRPGEMRWGSPYGEVRLNVLPLLPEPVRIRVEDSDLPVRPLDQIADADPAVARVIHRVRARRSR